MKIKFDERYGDICRFGSDGNGLFLVVLKGYVDYGHARYVESKDDLMRIPYLSDDEKADLSMWLNGETELELSVSDIKDLLNQS